MAARGVGWFCGARSFLDFLGYRNARWRISAGDAADAKTAIVWVSTNHYAAGINIK